MTRLSDYVLGGNPELSQWQVTTDATDPNKEYMVCLRWATATGPVSFQVAMETNTDPGTPTPVLNHDPIIGPFSNEADGNLYVNNSSIYPDYTQDARVNRIFSCLNPNVEISVPAPPPIYQINCEGSQWYSQPMVFVGYQEIETSAMGTFDERMPGAMVGTLDLGEPFVGIVVDDFPLPLNPYLTTNNAYGIPERAPVFDVSLLSLSQKILTIYLNGRNVFNGNVPASSDEPSTEFFFAGYCINIDHQTITFNWPSEQAALPLNIVFVVSDYDDAADQNIIQYVDTVPSTASSFIHMNGPIFLMQLETHLGIDVPRMALRTQQTRAIISEIRQTSNGMESTAHYYSIGVGTSGLLSLSDAPTYVAPIPTNFGRYPLESTAAMLTSDFIAMGINATAIVNDYGALEIENNEPEAILSIVFYNADPSGDTNPPSLNGRRGTARQDLGTTTIFSGQPEEKLVSYSGFVMSGHDQSGNGKVLIFENQSLPPNRIRVLTDPTGVESSYSGWYSGSYDNRINPTHTTDSGEHTFCLYGYSS